MTATILTSSILILAVLALRTILRGRVRAVTLYALWLVCALRLMLPFSVGESRISLENVVPAGADTAILSTETLNAEIASVPVWQETVISQQTVPEGSAEPLPPPVYRQETVRWHISTRDLLTILRWTGTACVLAAFLVSDTRFAARLRRDSVPDTVRGIPVRRSPALSVPCLYGCTIWLPESLSGDEAYYAAVHEQAHLRHADPVWIVLRILLAAVWWFDPLVWIASFASKQDAELAADESALAILGEDARVPYGRTLLSFAALRPETRDLFSTATPMARRSGLSARIRLLAASPRHSHVLTALALVLTLALTACAFAGPVTAPIADQFNDTITTTVGADTPITVSHTQSGTTRVITDPVPSGELAANVRKYLADRTIDESEAISLALERSGISVDTLTLTSAMRHSEDKRVVLDVELYAAGKNWYACQIDSLSGEIFQEEGGVWTRDARGRQCLLKEHMLQARGREAAAELCGRYVRENTATGISILSEDQIKAVALAYHLLPAEYVTFSEVRLIREAGEQIYKLSFSTAGGSSWEMELSAASGSLRKGGSSSNNLLKVPGISTEGMQIVDTFRDITEDHEIIGCALLDQNRNRHEYVIDCVTGAILPNAGAEWGEDRNPYLNFSDVTPPTFAEYVGTDSRTVVGDPILTLNEESGILLAEVSGEDYNGVLAIVRDPSKVRLVPSDSTSGQRIGELCEAGGAILGINASAYDDDNPGVPLGYVASGGEVLNESAGWTIVGFDEKDVLCLEQRDSMHGPLRDAAEFKPILLMNGYILVNKDDGWGINPRTAIGQTENGMVLLLVINGRSEESVGCRNYDCAQILSRYGAMNACALDEGSSSVMWYDGRVVSRPAGLNKTEGRQLPNAFVVLP